MKKFFVLLIGLCLMASPLWATPKGKKSPRGKKTVDYRAIEGKIYQLIASWYKWKEKIKKMDQKQLKQLLESHSLPSKLQKQACYSLFRRSDRAIQGMLQTTENIDGIMVEYIKAFRGVLHSNVGKNFLYQARLHQLARKLHSEYMDFWSYAYRRYYFLLKNNKNKSNKKAKKSRPFNLPKSAPAVTLMDGLNLRMQNQVRKSAEIFRAWRKASQAIDKMDPKVRAQIQRFYQHKNCSLGKDCPFGLTDLTMRYTYGMLIRSTTLNKRIGNYMRKHPEQAARVPMDLMMLGEGKAKLVGQAAGLVRATGYIFYKLVKKKFPPKRTTSQSLKKPAPVKKAPKK